MFPKWFDEWNKSNPTDVFKPAILLGTIGGAVFVAAMIVSYGQPYRVEAVQTGPPGIGMVIVDRVDAPPDPTLDLYYTEPPYPPEEGEPLAGEVYENVQVLADVPEGNFLRLMNAVTQWVSPEEGCIYCHENADEGLYADDNLYTKVVSRRMIQMTQTLNDEWAGHVQAGGAGGVNCYTCHRGENVPSEIWFDVGRVVEVMDGWGAVQNRATAIAQSTSLPSDALSTYLSGNLSGNAQIAVHDLESRVPDRPEDPGVPTWQDAERTYSLMNYFANSLGVNCVFCHNSRAFYDGGQVTPQWATASLGIAMVQELNQVYLEPLGAVYPPHRLGPIAGDAPKVACKTCHKGYAKPMGGMDAVSDWPELAAPGAPDYSALATE